MPRVKRGTKRNDRRKKILKRASGYFLTKSKLYQAAQEAVERGLKFAYSGRGRGAGPQDPGRSRGERRRSLHCARRTRQGSPGQQPRRCLSSAVKRWERARAIAPFSFFAVNASFAPSQVDCRSEHSLAYPSPGRPLL